MDTSWAAKLVETNDAGNVKWCPCSGFTRSICTEDVIEQVGVNLITLKNLFWKESSR